jgi:hypothetical protein
VQEELAVEIELEMVIEQNGALGKRSRWYDEELWRRGEVVVGRERGIEHVQWR